MYKQAKVAGITLGGYSEYIRANFSKLVNFMSVAFEHENEKRELGSFNLFE